MRYFQVELLDDASDLTPDTSCPVAIIRQDLTHEQVKQLVIALALTMAEDDSIDTVELEP